MSTDFQGTFQKKFHSKVIPGLLSILDDHENPRTQAHGGAALVNFAEHCPPRLLVEHLPQIIEKLEQVLSRKYQEVIHYLINFNNFTYIDLNSLFNIIVN
jgi:importin-5